MGLDPPRIGVTSGCECWDLSPGPLQEQCRQALTDEPPLQPLSMGLKSDSTASLLSLEGRDHCASFVLGGI